MKISDSLIKEFEHEAQTTRKHFERLMNEKFDWRPHEKSFTAGGLASHIVESIGWADPIFNSDEFDVDPRTYKPYQATSAAELLKTFDDNVALCSRVMAGISDEKMQQPWRLKIMGEVKFERTRAEVFRDFILSHLIHHRGQFSVYLRLLDIPVPGSYGPSADEEG